MTLSDEMLKTPNIVRLFSQEKLKLEMTEAIALAMKKSGTDYKKMSAALRRAGTRRFRTPGSIKKFMMHENLTLDGAAELLLAAGYQVTMLLVPLLGNERLDHKE